MSICAATVVEQPIASTWPDSSACMADASSSELDRIMAEVMKPFVNTLLCKDQILLAVEDTQLLSKVLLGDADFDISLWKSLGKKVHLDTLDEISTEADYLRVGLT